MIDRYSARTERTDEIVRAVDGSGFPDRFVPALHMLFLSLEGSVIQLFCRSWFAGVVAASMCVVLGACGQYPLLPWSAHAVVGPHDRLSEVNSGISSLALSSPTSDQVDSIGRFTKLRRIHVSGWTGDGPISFEPTMGLEHLREVELLSNRHLRDTHLAALNLKNVRFLRVNACVHVTTGVLEHIPKNNVLETLDLRECPLIDDSIVKHVGRLQGVKTLRIDFTGVSLEGAERLQLLLPDCSIDVLEVHT